MKPEIREVTDEITYYWSDVEVSLTFRGLHSTDSGAWRGMLEGHSTRAADRRNGGGHLIWQAVTITAPTDRAKIAERLQKKAPRADHQEWADDIERAFYDAYCRKAHVPDPVDLADVELDSLDVSHLFVPILPEGLVTLLLADQGSTKSYLMLYLAVCVVLGMPSVFGPPRRRGPVVYFDWEVDEQVARRRLGWICKGLGVEIPHGLHYVNMTERGRLVDSIQTMRQQTERLHAVMVVIDSLTFATGGDLNTAEYAAPTMSAIGSLGAGVTKLISAHPNKASRKMEVDDVSVIGSGLFEYRARAIWYMKRQSPRAASFIVTMTSRKPFDGAPTQPLSYRMQFDNEAHSARFLPAAAREVAEVAAEHGSTTDKIRHQLSRGQLDTNQLAELVGVDTHTIRSRCNEMPDVFPVLGGTRGRGKATVWRLGKPNAEDAEQLPWWNQEDDEDPS